MKNLIKIIASLTALTLMTACGGLTLPDLDLDLTGCQANVFRTSCGDEFKAARERVITECRTTFDTTGAVASQNCINAAEFVCNDTPFDPLCVDEEYVTIRTNTIKGCNAGTEEADICDRAVLAVCGANPYDRFCLEEESYDDDRAKIQSDCNSEDAACTETTLNNYCTTNPFRGVCLTPEYNQARSDLSRDCSTGGIGDPRCLTSTVNGVCRFDPFDSACDERYNNTRRNFCVTETTSTRCTETVKRICTANEYDEVCTGTPYADMRSTTASQAEIGTLDCPNRPGDGRCVQLYAFLCGLTPLDALCDAQGQYRDARRTLCLEETADPVACATTVSQVCLNNPLDDLCVGVDAYASAQETACRNRNAVTHPECAATLTRICGNLAGTSATGDPFSLTCRNNAFQPARAAITLACVGESSGRLCEAEILYTCRTTPFIDRCKGVETALPAQISACVSGTETDNCDNAEFFTDATIRGCLADPFSPDCLANQVFAPYVSEDVRCVLDITRAGCANPTAVVFATLPTTIRALRQNPDLSVPFHEGTNQYTGGFVNFDSTVLNDATGDLDAAKINALGDYLTDDSGVLAQNRTITLRRGGADSRNDDGVAYFYHFGSTSIASETSYSYAGILSTTNLGAPLLPQPVADGADNITAIWDGHFSFRNDIINSETEFLVDFTAGTMGFAKPVGTDGIRPPGTTFLGVGADGTHSVKWININLFVKLDAAFGPNAVRKTFTYDATQPDNLRETTTPITLAPGELGGNVFVYYRPTTDASPPADPDNFVRDNNTIHGLIGQEGAVAVYLEPGIGGSVKFAEGANTRVGGFTASNPDHPNNQ